MEAALHMNWYVLRVIGGRERQVSRLISSEVERQNLSELIHSVLVPLEKVYSVRNGKKVVREKVHISGYVFIRCVLSSEVSHFLYEIREVLGFLTDERGEPVPMREEEVARLLGQVQVQDLREEESDVSFFVGDEVLITEGPFNTFRGTITRINADKRRLAVEVKIFDRNTPIELEYHQVRRD